MMKPSSKRALVESIAVFGGVVAVIAEIMSATETDSYLSWNEAGRILGFAVFLGGIVATLDQVMQALHRMEELKKQVVDALDAAGTVRSLAYLERWCTESPQATHVAAAREVARHLSGFVPKLVGDIEQFCRGAPTTSTIVIEEQSPVHDLLATLAKKLPDGGVWLGVTLVEQEKAWSERTDAFSRFAKTIRDRIAAREVLAARLYDFSSREAKASMSVALAREDRAGVEIRTVIRGARQDMSLLYAPPDDERNWIRAPLGGDCVQRLKNQGYRLICAVGFKTREDGALRAASIYGTEHPESAVLEGQFEDSWFRSQPYVPEPKP